MKAFAIISVLLFPFLILMLPFTSIGEVMCREAYIFTVGDAFDVFSKLFIFAIMCVMAGVIINDK